MYKGASFVVVLYLHMASFFGSVFSLFSSRWCAYCFCFFFLLCLISLDGLHIVGSLPPLPSSPVATVFDVMRQHISRPLIPYIVTRQPVHDQTKTRWNVVGKYAPIGNYSARLSHFLILSRATRSSPILTSTRSRQLNYGSRLEVQIWVSEAVP